MNIKNTLLGLLVFFNFTIYAQTEKNYSTENDDLITEFNENRFTVKAKKIANLKMYNWNIIKEIYKNKPINFKLKIIVHYDEDGTFEKIDGNNIYQIIDCKVSNLNDVIIKLQKFSNNL